jgi:hypothetical protein
MQSARRQKSILEVVPVERLLQRKDMGDDQESVRATRGSRIASFRGGSAAGLLANSILSFFGR